MNRQLPSALDLTRPQFDGWACVWCSTPLRKGAVSAGRTEGHLGAHDLGVEVYACPACATACAPTDARSGQIPERCSKSHHDDRL